MAVPSSDKYSRHRGETFAMVRNPLTVRCLHRWRRHKKGEKHVILRTVALRVHQPYYCVLRSTAPHVMELPFMDKGSAAVPTELPNV